MVTGMVVLPSGANQSTATVESFFFFSSYRGRRGLGVNRRAKTTYRHWAR